MSDLFYRNPRLTVLVIGLIAVAGLAALEALGRQEDPTLARRFATVTTYYPGASALRVEALVTEKLEEKILELHEVNELDSLSRTGVSVVTIELDDAYEEADVDEIWSKVRDKLGDAEAELPAGIEPPEFEDRTSTAVTVLAGLVWVQDEEPHLGLLTRLAEELENRLQTLPNTKETELFGEAEEEVRVTVDPAALAAVSLTAADVSTAIARADTKVPAGQLRSAENDLLLEVAGELTTLERIRDIPLRREDDARILRVGDIASVEKTVRDPPATEAWIGGRPGVLVAVTMESGFRVDRWAARARQVVEDFRSEVPSGVSLELVFDQSGYTEQRLANLIQNLVLGAVIVLGVLCFMMGLRSALLVATALPLTTAAVLAQLNFMGVPLHQTSVTGLIVAIGLLIDNAIVVVDEFNQLRRKGATSGEAVRRTVQLLFVPLAASTLTTVLAFLPIVLMPGGAGEFVGPISISVGLAVTTSFLLAMSVIPALAGYLSPERLPQPDGSRRWWRDGFSHPGLEQRFRSTLRICLRTPALGIGVSLLLPITGFVVGQTLSEQFFPANDRDQFQIQLVLPAQTSLAETRDNALRARELVEAHPDVLESHWFVGETPPRVFYNMFSNQDGVPSYAGAFVTTRSSEATEALLPGLQRQLMAAFPNARAVALPFEQGPPFDAPIEVRLLGPDLSVLRALGEQVRAVLAETRAVTFTAAKLEGGEPKLGLRPDEDAARLAGLELADIAGQLNARLEGAVGGSVLEANQELPVRVRVGDGDRESLARIVSGRVLPPGRRQDNARGEMPGVPLAALAELELISELSGITHRDGRRSNTVQAFIEPYALISDALADFERRFEASGFELPEGYEIQYGGETELRSEALGNLFAFALPLFVVMAGSIILSFDSFRLAGIIFSVAFLAVGLALFGIWLFGYPLGFVGIVGTMGLVGLAINDAIVVLTALRSDPRSLAAELEGSVDVVVGATRHIIATTATTIGGLFPLILFGGRFWPPMATAIVGGVIGCSILALYFVPALFLLARRREQRRSARARVGPLASPTSPSPALGSAARSLETGGPSTA